MFKRIASRIVAELEQGVRPWPKPWNAEHAQDESRGPCGLTAPPWHIAAMRNRDLISGTFLALTAVGLVLLCSSLLAFAFT
ncbi:ArdC-like ssDNA-binding domain-containing protein [Bradyrhizobium sp. B124]|uniref:ArdC family protein n=1 Tax=Bradyrhizobium sp. B124 TaxID=3140245 RepID=UPI003183F93D